MSTEDQIRARELIEMRKKTREAAEMRVRLQAMGK
jgi:hypothetical protein